MMKSIFFWEGLKNEFFNTVIKPLNYFINIPGFISIIFILLQLIRMIRFFFLRVKMVMFVFGIPLLKNVSRFIISLIFLKFVK
jgi:hypothetical protein